MPPKYLNTIPELSVTSDDIQYSEDISSINDTSDELDSDKSMDASSIDINNSQDDYSGNYCALRWFGQILRISLRSQFQNQVKRLKERKPRLQSRLLFESEMLLIL